MFYDVPSVAASTFSPSKALIKAVNFPTLFTKFSNLTDIAEESPLKSMVPINKDFIDIIYYFVIVLNFLHYYDCCIRIKF